jgi:signal transduction histidine kinase
MTGSGPVRALPRRVTVPPIVFLAIGFAVLAVIVVMTLILAQRSQDYFERATTARDQRMAAVELRNALLAAESSHRGFIFSGNEVYLAPFETAARQATRWFDALDQATADNPEAKPLVEKLRTISSEKLTELKRSIALKRAMRDEEVMSNFRMSRDKALMDEANIFLSGLIWAAEDAAAEGAAEQRTNAAWLRLVTSVGGLIIVAVVGFAIASVLSHSRALSLAHGDLAALNANLEARIAARTADLQQANHEIQRFAYIVTHDLRAPLVNIMGFTSELEMGIEKLVAAVEADTSTAASAAKTEARVAAREDLPEAIRFIRSSTRTMDDLIKSILKLSREGRRTLRPEAVDLALSISSATAAVQHQVQQDGGSITTEVGVTTIDVDRLGLEQIMGNLLDNAVKYRSADRPLAITVRATPLPGDRVAVSVQDNGRGIAAQDMERIFEPFRRAGVLDQPGEGMGLAFVRALVNRMGGTIKATSTLDAGSTFTVTLPLRPTPDDAERS